MSRALVSRRVQGKPQNYELGALDRESRHSLKVRNVSGEKRAAGEEGSGGNDAVGRFELMSPAERSSEPGNLRINRDERDCGEQLFDEAGLLAAQPCETEKLEFGDGGDIDRHILRENIPEYRDDAGITLQVVNDRVGVAGVHGERSGND